MALRVLNRDRKPLLLLPHCVPLVHKRAAKVTPAIVDFINQVTSAIVHFINRVPEDSCWEQTSRHLCRSGVGFMPPNMSVSSCNTQ
eukprot:1215461-Amphidinium_carterae.6